MKNLILDKADGSWLELIRNNEDNLNKIDGFLEKKDYNPANENILRFLNNDLSKIKVVIIGQDTYPARGVATGRAFEVGGLTSWVSPFKQVSLKNIIRNLYGTYTNESPYISYSDIKKKISSGDFEILPPDKLFSHWEKQGVLLLNGALTCEVGKPGSHSEIWKPFIDEAIKYIVNNNKKATFFLWGSYASGFKSLIDNRRIYMSRHPMMCSESYPDDFIKNPCFKETMNEINWIN